MDEWISENGHLDLSWLSLVYDYTNFAYEGVLRDCARRGAARMNNTAVGADIVILGQDDVIFRDSSNAYVRFDNYEDNANRQQEQLCFQSFLGTRDVGENRISFLAAQYWSTSEIESAAQYIESQAGIGKPNSAVGLVEEWCTKRGDRKATRITNLAPQRASYENIH